MLKNTHHISTSNSISNLRRELMGITSQLCPKYYLCSDDYTARLAGTRSTYREGRVEIFYNGRWGSVCHNSFDSNAAAVICRQLGFPGSKTYRTYAYYGAGSGVIWLDDVSCVGDETNLASCTHNGFGTHDCSHSEDVGVVCDTSLSKG